MVNLKRERSAGVTGKIGDEGYFICTSGACPVQIEGEFEGKQFYFRARGYLWEIAIGNEEIIEHLWQPKLLDYYKSGCIGKPWKYEASWMEHSEALEIIKKAIEEWKCN